MNKKLTILCISDTHGKHKLLKNLPSADMIIHAGDFTNVGKINEVIDFMDWYSNLPYAYKIVIAGNHDWIFERDSELAKTLIPYNVIYLEDSGVETNGYNIYGSPVQKPFNNWAFNRPENILEKHWKAIPNSTDILITHTPPYKIGDYAKYSREHTGSPSLLSEITNRIKPLVSIFGHIHEGYGISKIPNCDTTFINASQLNEHYYLVNKPILFELIDDVINIL
jgi:Icc-related predicted phosphoesterase